MEQQPGRNQSHRAVSNGMVRPRTEQCETKDGRCHAASKIAVSHATNWRILCVAGVANRMSKQVQTQSFDAFRDQSGETSPDLRLPLI